MDLDHAKEFIGESQDEALTKAAKHFGVSEKSLEFQVLPKNLQISGVGERVVLVAAVKDEPMELGPVGEFVLGMLERMKLGGRLRLNEVEEEGQVTVRINSPALAEAAERDGRVLDALSHLAERAAQKLIGPDADARVEIPGLRENERAERPRERNDHRGDRGDRRPRRDRDRRDSRGRDERSDGDAELEVRARKAAEEVLASGEAALLEPMNSKQRWIVHHVVNEMSGLHSESVGEGRLRRVKIEAE